MHVLRWGLLIAVLATSAAQGATGQTPAPGQTPGQTPAGQTPGHTPSPGVAAPHNPVCPDQAHIRLPQNTSPFPTEQITTTVYGNCSDPDGDHLTYNSPGVLPKHVPFFLDDQGADVTHLRFDPEVGFAGQDFMQYFALDPQGHQSNVTDFYIEVVPGLKEASAVWTGTVSPDTLSGTEVSDQIAGLAGNDTIDSGAGNDKVNSGPGDDTVVAGAGNDVITDTGGGGATARVAGAAAKAKGAFHNRISAGAGNDRINVANRKRDRVDCGSGKDSVVADKIDKLIGCEKAKRRH